MHYFFDLDGEQVEVHFTRRGGPAFWCSHWEKIWELVKRGMLRTEHGGPATYGHVDFYMNVDEKLL
jgi:hypothetical protein